VSDQFVIRPATLDDSVVIARQRVAMFRDMGRIPVELVPALEEATLLYLREAVPIGEYFAWLASPHEDRSTIVAGAGVQVRRVLPFPPMESPVTRIARGRQAIVLNVYTEPAWRRRGIAKLLMDHVIAWARSGQLDGLVLHASDDGRALYEKLGFVQTNEMRYLGELAKRP
jgi:GNAT superfamily N-acetyltransferase